MRNAIETIEKGDLKAEIFVDEFNENPRKDWDHLGKMVCWSRNHTLGDEMPKWGPEEFYYRIVSDWYFYERKERVNIPHLDDVSEAALPGYKEKLQKTAEELYVILPLHLYDHSGITMSTGRFSCPWDSGQVGYIYMSLDKARKNWESSKDVAELIEKATACLEAEVKEYDQYLTNDVYSVIITREDTCDHGTDHREDVDSCGGFYGLAFALQEAQNMLDNATKTQAAGGQSK